MRYQIQFIKGTMIEEVVDCEDWPDLIAYLSRADSWMDEDRCSIEIVKVTQEAE